jgi:hypothetical protein
MTLMDALIMAISAAPLGLLPWLMKHRDTDLLGWLKKKRGKPRDPSQL